MRRMLEVAKSQEETVSSAKHSRSKTVVLLIAGEVNKMGACCRSWVSADLNWVRTEVIFTSCTSRRSTSG